VRRPAHKRGSRAKAGGALPSGVRPAHSTTVNRTESAAPVSPAPSFSA